MRENNGICVIGEVNERGMISRISLEILGLGRQLADDLSVELSAIFIGADVKKNAQESICFGSDRAYALEVPSLSGYNPDLYLRILKDLFEDFSPMTLLAGHTALGQDLLPRLAARFQSQVTMDCVHLALAPGTRTLLMTKPIFGGNALAVFSCKSLPQMATIRIRVGEIPDRIADRDGEVIMLQHRPNQDSSRTSAIRTVYESHRGIKLEDARVVVSGGRGIGGSEGFDQLRALARLLGGTIGASRPPCDMGWISSSSQVGLTGKSVAPDLYLAIGISGTMQHLTGISESRHVVAINRDEDANIFRCADYGVVGDYKEILPSLIFKLKEHLGDSI